MSELDRVIAAVFEVKDARIAELEGELDQVNRFWTQSEKERQQAEATIEQMKNTIDLCSGPCSYAERSTP